MTRLFRFAKLHLIEVLLSLLILCLTAFMGHTYRTQDKFDSRLLAQERRTGEVNSIRNEMELRTQAMNRELDQRTAAMQKELEAAIKSFDDRCKSFEEMVKTLIDVLKTDAGTRQLNLGGF